MKVLSTILPVKSFSKFNFRINSQKIFSEKMYVVEKPVIANIKGYYRSAEDKLNEIYLDKLKAKLPTANIEYNIDKFERLPDAVKDAIKPNDISRYGEISQAKVDQVWEAAKKAHKPGVYGPSPKFRGTPENDALETLHIDNIPDISISNNLDSMPEGTGLADELANAGADNIDNILDITSDSTADISEQGTSLLDRIIDIFT